MLYVTILSCNINLLIDSVQPQGITTKSDIKNGDGQKDDWQKDVVAKGRGALRVGTILPMGKRLSFSTAYS